MLTLQQTIQIGAKPPITHRKAMPQLFKDISANLDATTQFDATPALKFCAANHINVWQTPIKKDGNYCLPPEKTIFLQFNPGQPLDFWQAHVIHHEIAHCLMHQTTCPSIGKVQYDGFVAPCPCCTYMELEAEFFAYQTIQGTINNPIQITYYFAQRMIRYMQNTFNCCPQAAMEIINETESKIKPFVKMFLEKPK